MLTAAQLNVLDCAKELVKLANHYGYSLEMAPNEDEAAKLKQQMQNRIFNLLNAAEIEHPEDYLKEFEL